VTELRERSRALFARLAELAPDDPERAAVRDELVALHTGLAVSTARRFSRRGEPSEDLEQVAMIGLLKAIDRFDPQRQVEFSTFATPTVLGEVRRHFRDTAWALHVPRGLRELSVQIGPTVEALTAELDRSPRPSEVAARLGVSTARVVEALEAADAYATIPLDAPLPEGRSLADTLGGVDAALDRVHERAALRPLIDALPERERTILAMRFFEEMSQSQIASRVGVSQMHVSRLLAHTLATLREGLADDVEAARAVAP
jgi:RNA polymerase sigma-B factor